MFNIKSINRALFLLGERLEIESSEPLGKVVKQVAGDLRLEEKWINTGPTELVKFGLPEGFRQVLIDMLRKVGYGKIAERI